MSRWASMSRLGEMIHSEWCSCPKFPKSRNLEKFRDAEEIGWGMGIGLRMESPQMTWGSIGAARVFPVRSSLGRMRVGSPVSAER